MRFNSPGQSTSYKIRFKILYFDILGGTYTVSLIDWLYDNVEDVTSVGACPYLMSSG